MEQAIGATRDRTCNKATLQIPTENHQRGADVNAATDDGYTALIYAAYSGHAKIVKELIERGADIDATNNYGSTALIYAAHKVITHTVIL